MSGVLTAVSLFSSGGIGDLALREAGIEILVSNELLEDRQALFARNFPATTTISGDIRLHVDEIIGATESRLSGRSLGILYATPPCQGMSKSGRGKLLSEIKAGRRPPVDERNQLIVPAMLIAKRLKPAVVLLENVPEMRQTIILDHDGTPMLLLDFVRRELGPEYVGGDEVVEFANYGVPQRRQRLITILSRRPEDRRFYRQAGTFLPAQTHSKDGVRGLLPWQTVRDAIAHFLPLDAGNKATATSTLPFHRVPLLDKRKYWWVAHTPPGATAFSNQCAACGSQRNPTHRAKHTKDGINRASSETPVYCIQCGTLLPRPSVQEGSRHRIMSGYTSAYKRMDWDAPASALTQNLSYACSDNKLHPEQHRVLSLAEALRIQTIDQFAYEWGRADGKHVRDQLIRDIIGESVPPVGLLVILKHILNLPEVPVALSGGVQWPLFALTP